MNLLGYKIRESYPSLSAPSKSVVNTINPHSYCVAKKDSEFRDSLEASDILLPDGIGIVLAARILKNEKIKKIAGYDLFLNLMQQLNETGGTCVFLGAAPETLEKIHKRANMDYPNVKVHSFSPPYKPIFNEEDSHLMCDKVNSVSPDVLFVGMTAPKQEKWVHQNKANLNAKVIGSIGAVFDFYAGTVKRPSKFWINLGLEWLPRFLKEPKRLAERNLVSTPKFVWEVLKERVKQ
ncbi:WecB/TagA/CpsF family glycosyltransferase [Zunongwangia sp. F363]|uniref:WecB/TagA/CpsF family glycosyltransferase n=1 Tax=Autumnicola tepida TaxID=3075595 RepID=A0ABU3C7R4_9FLAO|nr:WecB/TagA/CpsF family glycosyltransferase [Zunongwangia sp. F363]MDT0642313.1 WecB/TagA/CpsF family glycosyltransferase [Zunongwangia sp. F363]